MMALVLVESSWVRIQDVLPVPFSSFLHSHYFSLFRMLHHSLLFDCVCKKCWCHRNIVQEIVKLISVNYSHNWHRCYIDIYVYNFIKYLFQQSNYFPLHFIAPSNGWSSNLFLNRCYSYLIVQFIQYCLQTVVYWRRSTKRPSPLHIVPHSLPPPSPPFLSFSGTWFDILKLCWPQSWQHNEDISRRASSRKTKMVV